jgi:hypothetical protein
MRRRIFEAVDDAGSVVNACASIAKIAPLQTLQPLQLRQTLTVVTVE